jgi:hypothetical protein
LVIADAHLNFTLDEDLNCLRGNCSDMGIRQIDSPQKLVKLVIGHAAEDTNKPDVILVLGDYL